MTDAERLHHYIPIYTKQVRLLGKSTPNLALTGEELGPTRPNLASTSGRTWLRYIPTLSRCAWAGTGLESKDTPRPVNIR
jgi:hypothetical protein